VLDSASQYLNNAKAKELSPVGLAKNTGINALQLLLGVPQTVAGANKLQQQYGTPNELLFSNPVKYLETMSAPIKGYAQNLAEYTPLQDILKGDVSNYPQRVTDKVYQNPVNTLFDALAVVGAVNTLKPNKTNIAAGNELKRQTASKRVQADVSPEQEALNMQRNMLESKLSTATGTVKKQLRNALDDINNKIVEVLKTKQAEETIKMRKPKLKVTI
jgi:hypothetical protein